LSPAADAAAAFNSIFAFCVAGPQVLRPSPWQVVLFRSAGHLRQALPAAEHRPGDLPRQQK